MKTHYQLIDAVNNAKDEAEHNYALAVLEGYRMGIEVFCQWSGIDCDLYTMSRFGGDASMCCGVLTDWEPK